MKSRRLKIVSIDERQVFDWFVQASRSWTPTAKFLELPTISVLPPDYQVLEVRHEPFRKAFAFLVHSESFDEVPSGHEIPGMIAVTRYEAVQIRTDEDRWREQDHLGPSTADLDMRDKHGIEVWGRSETGNGFTICDSNPSGNVANNCYQTVTLDGRFTTADLVAGMKHAIAKAEEGCDKPLILK